MTVREMKEMRLKGATYTQIGKAWGVTRQRVNYLLTHYDEALKGMRGHGFDIEDIVYKGFYEHFRDNLYESITSFAVKVYGYANNTYIQTFRKFVTGKQKRNTFPIPIIKKMCEVTGKSFEELFELRGKE